MTSNPKLTAPKAAASVLEAVGFARVKRGEWVRTVGDYEDVVDLQISSGFDSMTVNVSLLDKQIHALMVDLAKGETFAIYPVWVRLPHHVFGTDIWWERSDPNAPEQIAAMIRDHGLPLLDSLHSPEGLLAYLEPTIVKWRNVIGRQYAAVLLHEMGRQAEACALMADPPRRLQRGAIGALREHLGCELADGEPSKGLS